MVSYLRVPRKQKFDFVRRFVRLRRSEHATRRNKHRRKSCHEVPSCPRQPQAQNPRTDSARRPLLCSTAGRHRQRPEQAEENPANRDHARPGEGKSWKRFGRAIERANFLRRATDRCFPTSRTNTSPVRFTRRNSGARATPSVSFSNTGSRTWAVSGSIESPR